MHACTGTNTANLSEPTACMNRSIASTLPRTWQDINNSLDPTAASNWQLSSIKRYTSESRPPLHPPPFKASRRLFIEWSWRQNYIAPCILTCGTYQKGRVSLRAQGTKRQVIFHCAYACPTLNHVMLWNMVAGSLTSLSIFNYSSCLQNSLPTWLSPSLALRQCCQFAVVHGMLKKMTGSFNYLSCSMISDNKYKIRTEIIQQ
jgi:hypothetical protein